MLLRGTGDWVIGANKNALLKYEFDADEVRSFPVTTFSVVAPVSRHDQHIVVAAIRHEEEVATLLIYDLNDLAAPRAVFRMDGTRVDGQGEDGLWALLPHVYLAGTGRLSRRESLVVRGDSPGVLRTIKLPRSVDTGDRAEPSAILDMPELAAAVLIRGTALIVVDLHASEVAQTVKLPASLSISGAAQSRGGTSEVWACCGSLLVRVDAEAGRVVQAFDLGTWKGDLAIDVAVDFGFAVCALHKSGEVVALDCDTSSMERSRTTAEMLWRVGLLEDGRFAAQVWDSGRFVQGRLQLDRAPKEGD